jgi:hypothetical protein
MKSFLIAALVLLPAAFAHAEGTADSSAASATKPGVPVETVKVTDQADSSLFDRVRDAETRAEKKGEIAVAAPSATTTK